MTSDDCPPMSRAERIWNAVFAIGLGIAGAATLLSFFGVLTK